MKKKIFISIIIFIVVVIIKYYVSSYEINYNIDGYHIITKYKSGRFYIELEKDILFNFDILAKRKFAKLKIDKITEINGEDFFCIYPSIKGYETYPLCSKDGLNIDFNLIDSEILTEYKNINNLSEVDNETFHYYNILDKNTSVALWNYNGYTLMNSKSYENYELFKNDKYDNNLSYQFLNYVIMPNYDEPHEFSNFVLFNLKTGKHELFKTEYTFDYNSYFVGSYKKNIYFYDIKNSVLYEINIKNKSVSIKSNEEKGYVKLENGKFVETQRREYKINKIKYEVENNYNYTYYSNDGLYKITNDNNSITTKIFDKDVNIVNQFKDKLYFTYENYLYMYSPIEGVNKIFYHFELNFNKDNIIYVYSE